MSNFPSKKVSTSKAFLHTDSDRSGLGGGEDPAAHFKQPLLYGWMGEIVGDAFPGGNDTNFRPHLFQKCFGA